MSPPRGGGVLTNPPSVAAPFHPSLHNSRAVALECRKGGHVKPTAPRCLVVGAIGRLLCLTASSGMNGAFYSSDAAEGKTQGAVGGGTEAGAAHGRPPLHTPPPPRIAGPAATTRRDTHSTTPRRCSPRHLVAGGCDSGDQSNVHVSWLSCVRRDGLFDHRTRQEVGRLAALSAGLKLRGGGGGCRSYRGDATHGDAKDEGGNHLHVWSTTTAAANTDAETGCSPESVTAACGRGHQQDSTTYSDGLVTSLFAKNSSHTPQVSRHVITTNTHSVHLHHAHTMEAPPSAAPSSAVADLLRAARAATQRSVQQQRAHVLPSRVAALYAPALTE